MRTQNKFWWFVALALFVTTITFITLGVFFWRDLTPIEKHQFLAIVTNHPTYFFMAAILVIAALGFAMDGALNNYILPLNRMLEQSRIILSANPAHRLHIDGGRSVQQLADLFNLMAVRMEKIHEQVASEVATARDDIEREKTILAAMVSELPQGVVICNMDHRIILYNRQAKHLFGVGVSDVADPPQPAGTGAEHFIGLGRSIMELVDGALIQFALENIRRNVARDDTSAAAHFVTPGKAGRLIQTEMVPVLDGRHEFNGYILMFEDVTERMESRHRISSLLERLITSARASLAGIRSAIEFMVAFPDLEAERRTKLRTIIRDEAVTLSAILDESAAQLPAATRSSWPLMPIRLDDLRHALKQRCASGTNACLVETPSVGGTLWVKADSYLLLTALSDIIARVVEQAGVVRIAVHGRIEGRFVHLDLVWKGAPVSMERLQKWLNAPVRAETTQLPMTLGQVIERHDGELIPWAAASSQGADNGLRILLPTLAPPAAAGQGRSAAVMSASRPEFYDFDLFSQPGQQPSTDSQPLEALSFTVFDTETTGLDPRGGDEIISIGAVRIVNQRLLRQESFDQLVDPQREIPWASVKYHGIQQDMVKGKPTVDRVLAQFHRFAADTVLVAHNAAFDMRMLQMKEVATGIYFINPVLDTMLLSAVVHPTHKDHSLETIALRLGVVVVGRHTALGDAITTAEVFLKLIPLLKQQGIRSLMDARRASQKTYFARMTY